MSALLEVEGLCRRFGGLYAVSELNFCVQRDEILGLIGPNGAGKSTVFNLINGVHRPDRGSVRFRGSDITGHAPHRVVRYGVARTHQIVQPLVDMTVFENCTVSACFGAENLPISRAREIVRDVLVLVGLEDRRDVPAGQLTIAYKKRLELARAMCARPALLLLDEVLAGLNPTEVEHMIGVIRAIHEQGISILMIEHLMQAIMNLSHRVVVLNYGKKLAEGTPMEVANNADVITAYLGDTSIAEKFSATAKPGAANE
jgi:branched-chain amino acid transport system ATP-binding protein